MYTQMRDKKMLLEAQQMLEDARTKIEIVRMQMLRVQQAGKQQQQQNSSSQDSNSQEVCTVICTVDLLVSVELRFVMIKSKSTSLGCNP